MIRALIFDFDGLIMDTEGPDFQAWCETYEEHGCRLSRELWVQGIGRSWADMPWHPLAELERQLGGTFDREGVRARRRQRLLELVGAQGPMPGVLDMLEQAEQRGVRLGIASSASREWLESQLQRLGLRHRFDAVRCADHVERTKPDPAAYLAALDALGVVAGEAVAFEDSPSGVLAARRAGIRCVAVPNGMTRELCFDHADLCVRSLADLSWSALEDLVETGRSVVP